MESIKKGDFSVDAFLKIYCNTPEKLGDINDFSARLLLTKEYLLQRFADAQIYQYVQRRQCAKRISHTVE